MKWEMSGINLDRESLSSNYLLYEDETQRIEIINWFHSYLQKLNGEIEVIPSLSLDFDLVLDTIEDELKDRDISLINVIIPSTIPIIKFCQPMTINEPFNIFNDILHYLCWFPSLLNAPEEIAEAVECFSDEKVHFYCNIWEEPIDKVQGYIIGINQKNERLLLPFGVKEELDE